MAKRKECVTLYMYDRGKRAESWYYIRGRGEPISFDGESMKEALEKGLRSAARRGVFVTKVDDIGCGWVSDGEA